MRFVHDDVYLHPIETLSAVDTLEEALFHMTP